MTGPAPDADGRHADAVRHLVEAERLEGEAEKCRSNIAWRTDALKEIDVRAEDNRIEAERLWEEAGEYRRESEEHEREVKRYLKWMEVKGAERAEMGVERYRTEARAKRREVRKHKWEAGAKRREAEGYEREAEGYESEAKEQREKAEGYRRESEELREKAEGYESEAERHRREAERNRPRRRSGP